MEGLSIASDVEWRTSTVLVDYDEAVSTMESRVAEIAAGNAPELVWLLEHPPLYTAGVSASDDELIEPGRFPVFRTGRGGKYTYHGPGQRVAYVMLDLKQRGSDLRAYVQGLEEWIIRTLAELGVAGERRAGRIGIWIQRPDNTEAKIAAIGVRVRRWVSYHGIALNVAPDLSHFSGIVPCGLEGYGVTSLKALGRTHVMGEADAALKRTFPAIFGTAIRSRG